MADDDRPGNDRPGNDPVEKVIPIGQHGGYRPGAGRKKTASKAGRPTKTEQGDAYTILAKAKAKHEHFKAQMAELEFKREAGKLLRIEDVQATWTERVFRAKNRLLALPSRIAPAVLGMEELRDIERAVRDAVLDALSELNSTDH